MEGVEEKSLAMEESKSTASTKGSSIPECDTGTILEQHEENGVTITGLVKGVSAMDLKQYLVQFTKVKKVKLVTSLRESDSGNCFAYVTLPTPQGVEKILECVDGKTWNGCRLKVAKKLFPEMLLRAISIATTKKVEEVSAEHEGKSDVQELPKTKPKVASQDDSRFPDSSTERSFRRTIKLAVTSKRSREREMREYEDRGRERTRRGRSRSVERCRARFHTGLRTPSPFRRSPLARVERAPQTSRQRESASPRRRRLQSVSPPRKSHRDSPRKRNRSRSSDRHDRHRSRRESNSCEDRPRNSVESRLDEFQTLKLERERIRKEREEVEQHKHELIQVERLIQQVERERLEKERKAVNEKLRMLDKQSRRRDRSRSSSPSPPRKKKTIAEMAVGRGRGKDRERRPSRERRHGQSNAFETRRHERNEREQTRGNQIVDFIPIGSGDQFNTGGHSRGNEASGLPYVPRFIDGIPVNPPAYMIPPPPPPPREGRGFMSYPGWPTRGMIFGGSQLTHPNFSRHF